MWPGTSIIAAQEWTHWTNEMSKLSEERGLHYIMTFGINEECFSNIVVATNECTEQILCLWIKKWKMSNDVYASSAVIVDGGVSLYNNMELQENILHNYIEMDFMTKCRP